MKFPRLTDPFKVLSYQAAQMRYAQGGLFDESKHPRDEKGRFTSGGGGSGDEPSPGGGGSGDEPSPSRGQTEKQKKVAAKVDKVKAHLGDRPAEDVKGADQIREIAKAVGIEHDEVRLALRSLREDEFDPLVLPDHALPGGHHGGSGRGQKGAREAISASVELTDAAIAGYDWDYDPVMKYPDAQSIVEAEIGAKAGSGDFPDEYVEAVRKEYERVKDYWANKPFDDSELYD